MMIFTMVMMTKKMMFRLMMMIITLNRAVMVPGTSRSSWGAGNEER